MKTDTISLDLWGGSHTFDTVTNTYTINRLYGLFSNITVCMYGIAKIKTLGYNVDTIKFYLAEYANDYDFYNDLFIKEVSNYNELTMEEAQQFINTIHPTAHGLSRGWGVFYKEDINKVKHILNKIFYKYFNFNVEVINYYNSIVQNNNINFKKTIFILARKTDKIHELKIPSVQDYYTVANKITNIDSILIQTDDISVANEFLLIGDKRIKILQEIPLSTNNSGFHERLYSVSEEDFYKKYNLSKKCYLQKMLAIVKIASNIEYCICYPGNLTTVIPIIRDSFDNCILF